MARTPKSERQYGKASAAEERTGGRSHRNLGQDNHPSHRQHVRALDRHDAKLARFDKDYDRSTRRG